MVGHPIHRFLRRIIPALEPIAPGPTFSFRRHPTETQPYAPGMQLKIGKDGAASWYMPGFTKTKYDFPKAKDGGPQTLEFAVGDRHRASPSGSINICLSAFRDTRGRFCRR